MAATAIRAPLVRLRAGRLDDGRLAALAASGDERAFEVIYDRHHRALLGFCRHMLGSQDEGEDALQQTFLRAHRSLVTKGAPDDVRPWLFAIARNRCRSLHAARKDAPTPDEDFEPVTDGLSSAVEQRADLRALLADIESLPEDQRSALVLAELADMPHEEIGSVIGVPGSKVKALVHQARTHLIAERDARETPCEQIREQLATARGGELRRGPLRRHLNRCEGCREYRKAVAEQRVALGLLLPVIPSAGLKDAIFGALGGGGGGGAAAAAAGAGASGGAAVSGAGGAGLGAKLAIGAALLGSAGGGTALVETQVLDRAPAEPKSAQQAREHPAAAKTPAAKLVAAEQKLARKRSSVRTLSAADRKAEQRGHAYGKKRNGNNGVRDHGAGEGKQPKPGKGNANGSDNGKALGRSGTPGASGQTRRAEVQQRNAERRTTRTDQKAASEKKITPQPARGQGQDKVKAVKPTPVITPAPTPEATVVEAPATQRARNKDAAEPVTDVVAP